MNKMERRTPTVVLSKRSGTTKTTIARRDQKLYDNKRLNSTKPAKTVTARAKVDSRPTVNNSIIASDPSQFEENMVVHYVDDGLDKDHEDESDSETLKDSVSSQGDSFLTEDEKIDVITKSKSSPSRGFKTVSASVREPNRLKSKTIHSSTLKKSVKVPAPYTRLDKVKVHPQTQTSSESSEEVKEVDVWDDASNSALSDTEIVNGEENLKNAGEEISHRKIEDLETRLEKLKEELREVAALEISLYSIVPEHGSSAHKLHTPARRLSRLYFHASKNWTQNKRGTIAKSTVSGLILVAKSCGNDVARLTFWLSNTIVLREIISQTFGCSRSKRCAEIAAALKQKATSGGIHLNGSLQFSDDWQETSTFVAALGKVESWIFSRLVESVWWQVLMPHMQSPVEKSPGLGKLWGPTLETQQQGRFSINLWKNAFQDALQRLCPIRAGGHDCGCLPILARRVMEQCISRLDVAMFNAILRESAHEIPTDPVSDPILDSKVLPIPAGDLSFGSGAQLKNAIGNWSRWLTDLFGIDADDSPKEEQENNTDMQDRKSFCLLNDLSDLLMLPKDMLMERTIREEVCPSIGLSLVKRILCNFTPDEFCPDSVPGAVLEVVNAESIAERILLGDSSRNFPYPAAAVEYSLPSSLDVAEKVAEIGGRSHLSRNTSAVQRKGYTSDDELEELDYPLASIIDKPIIKNAGGRQNDEATTNVRYELLREVWST